MKNIIKSLALAAVVLVSGASFTACKKGENDPGISLASRKGRLVGEWKLSKGERKSTSGGNTTTTTFTETSATITSTGGGSTTYSYTQSLTIEKDGTFTQVEVVTYPGSTAETYTTKGRWTFMGRNKSAEYKNKEAIVMSSTSRQESGTGTCNCTTTDSNPDIGDIFELDMLKSKEMAMVYKNNYSNPSNSGSYESIMTYVQ